MHQLVIPKPNNITDSNVTTYLHKFTSQNNIHKSYCHEKQFKSTRTHAHTYIVKQQLNDSNWEHTHTHIYSETAAE